MESSSIYDTIDNHETVIMVAASFIVLLLTVIFIVFITTAKDFSYSKRH